MVFRFRLACSFCGRSAAQVEKLVAGRHAYICDRCAEQTMRIMEASGNPPTAAPPGLIRRIIGQLRRRTGHPRAWTRLGSTLSLSSLDEARDDPEALEGSKGRAFLAGSLAAVLMALFLVDSIGQSQQAGSLIEQFRQRSITAEQNGLVQPFKGIMTSAGLEPGLFAIRSTGVTTEPVRRAAESLLAALTPAQRDKTLFGLDDPEWRKWMNQHFYQRQGVSFLEMNESQREAGFALLRASLSARGLKQTRDIMRLNETLGELNNNDFEQYGEWRYHITVMGSPSATEPWGWQFDGHHAIINYFVLGDQVVMSPFFAGSEPVRASSGKYKGTVILQEEQDRGLAMIDALDASQKGKAILQASKTGNNNLTEAWKDNVVLDYAGISAADLSGAQRQQLLDLAALYVNNMNDGHARVKMEEVRRLLNATRFAWIGDTKPGSVFYYRIHSPVVLIEFDHQNPANLRQLAPNPNVPNHEHVHVVVRTPNGNDYGKDLLRQHYQQHPHPPATSSPHAQ